MKIIITESQKKVIAEDLGVSVSSVPYVNLVYSILEKEVNRFILSKDKKYSTTISLGLNDLKTIYQNNFDDFIEFPIEGIIIDFYANVVKSGSIPSSFTSGGAAYQIEPKKEKSSYLTKPNLSLPKKVLDEVEVSVIAKFDFNLYITKEYDSSMKDELLYDFRDTIMHEFNHLYEFYNRSKNKKGLVDTTLSYAGSKNYNVPREIFNIWETFIYLVYFSEPYEMRAMTQEAYSVRLRMDFEEFKTTKFWRYAKMMENFDANKLFDDLISKIESHNPEYLVPIMNRLYLWFMRDYYQGVKNFGYEPKKMINKSKHLLDLMEKFQPRIKMAGKKLQRNYMRLYSLSPE
jgi:hypothetical protein